MQRRRRLGFRLCLFAATELHVLGASPDTAQRYIGDITKFGVYIGYSGSAVIVWAVFAPTTNLAPGSLAGNYAGATGSAAAGPGAGANVLVGGSNQSVSLQPVSIQGGSGLNVAAGIAAMSLQPAGH